MFLNFSFRFDVRSSSDIRWSLWCCQNQASLSDTNIS